MKGAGGALFVLGILMVVAFLIGGGSCIAKRMDVGRDIGAPLNRAQVASNPNDMDKFLAYVQEGLEDHGFTDGHWKPYNPNDDNDFAVVYQSVLSLRERLTDVKKFDRSSTEYQVAMDDLRGTIRELNIGQQEAVSWSYWWVWALLAVGIVFLICGTAFTTYKDRGY